MHSLKPFALALLFCWHPLQAQSVFLEPGSRSADFSERLQTKFMSKWNALPQEKKDKVYENIRQIKKSGTDIATKKLCEKALEGLLGDLGAPVYAFFESTEANPRNCAEIPNALCK